VLDNPKDAASNHKFLAEVLQRMSLFMARFCRADRLPSRPS
jgi:hypothetical protein